MQALRQVLAVNHETLGIDLSLPPLQDTTRITTRIQMAFLDTTEEIHTTVRAPLQDTAKAGTTTPLGPPSTPKDQR